MSIQEDKSVDETNNEKNEIEYGSSCQENKEGGKSIPPEIKLKTEVFGIDFHHNSNVVAAGEINGRVTLFSISPEGNKSLLNLKQHKKACRSVSFSKCGDKLYSCSKDKSIKAMDMNTGCVLHDKQNAHESHDDGPVLWPNLTSSHHDKLAMELYEQMNVNVVPKTAKPPSYSELRVIEKKPINCMEILSENYMASGCDGGVVKIWDTRTFGVIAEHNEHKDYISDMTSDKEGRFLLCTGGDGLLSVFNTRKKKIDGLSDQQDDELLSVKIVKNKQKVVCGSSSGTLSIFSWGEWGDISDRVPALSDGIDSICVITDDVICTGSADGVIRALYVQPHRGIGVIGKHGNFGIENLKLSPDKLLVASSSETSIKFWDVSHLQEETIEPIKQKKVQRKRRLEESSKKENNFFADL